MKNLIEGMLMGGILLFVFIVLPIGRNVACRESFNIILDYSSCINHYKWKGGY